MLTPKKTKTDKAIERYHQALKEYAQQKVKHEGALETAFQRLLEEVARSHHCALIPKQKIKAGDAYIFPDGSVFEKMLGSLTPSWAIGKPRTLMTISTNALPPRSRKSTR